MHRVLLAYRRERPHSIAFSLVLTLALLDYFLEMRTCHFWYVREQSLTSLHLRHPNQNDADLSWFDCWNALCPLMLLILKLKLLLNVYDSHFLFWQVENLDLYLCDVDQLLNRNHKCQMHQHLHLRVRKHPSYLVLDYCRKCSTLLNRRARLFFLFEVMALEWTGLFICRRDATTFQHQMSFSFD